MSAGGSASLGRGGVLAGAGAAGRAQGRQRRTGLSLGRLVQLWTRSTVASSTSLIRRLGRLAGAATSLRWSTETEAAGLWTRPQLSRVECLRPSIGLAVGYDRPRGRPVELCLYTLVWETDMQRWGGHCGQVLRLLLWLGAACGLYLYL